MICNDISARVHSNLLFWKVESEITANGNPESQHTLDRLGRDAIDVSSTVANLEELGIRVHCLALGGVDLTSSAGKLTMGVINAVAQFERDLLIERTQAGLARAKSEGKILGRPPALSHEQQETVRQRLSTGESVSAIARDQKVSRQTIMRARDAVE